MAPPAELEQPETSPEKLEPTFELEPQFEPEPKIEPEPKPEPTYELEPKFEPEPTLGPKKRTTKPNLEPTSKAKTKPKAEPAEPAEPTEPIVRADVMQELLKYQYASMSRKRGHWASLVKI